jgi:beta-lactamase class D
MTTSSRVLLLGALPFSLVLAASPVYASSGAPPPPVDNTGASDIPGTPRVREDGAAFNLFRAAGVDGAFVLLDVTRNELTVVNPDIAGRRYVPCSTFKIPNTVVALETGALPSAQALNGWPR